MKRVLDPNVPEYVFNATAGTIDFNSWALPYYDKNLIYAVINTTYNGGTLIYTANGTGTLGGNMSSGILSLNYPMTGMNNSDILMVIVDDPNPLAVNVQSMPNIGFLPNQEVYANDKLTQINGAATLTAGNNILNATAGSGATDLAASGAMAKTVTVAMVFSAGATSGGPVLLEGSPLSSGQPFTSIPYTILSPLDRSGLTSQGNAARPLTDLPIQPLASNTVVIQFSTSYRYVRLRLETALAGTVQTYAFYGTERNDQTLSVQHPDRVRAIGTITPTVGINILTNDSTTLFPVLPFRSFTAFIRGNSGITAGQLIYEESMDGSNWMSVSYWVANTTSPGSNVGSWTVAASNNYWHIGNLTQKYFRIRCSTAFSGGSMTGEVVFNSFPNNNRQFVFSEASVNAVTLRSTTTTDVSAATITSTTTTEATSLVPQMNSGAITIQVNAISGTNPTLDVAIQGRNDALGVAAWFDIYTFPRITASGTYVMPMINYDQWSRLRYVQTVGGTSPSINRQISRKTSTVQNGLLLMNFINRTLTINTLNSTTSDAWIVEGTGRYTMVLSLAAGGTAPTIQLQGSSDNVNWYTIGTTLAGTVGATVALSIVDAVMAKRIRVLVTTAGVGATLNYIEVTAKGEV